MPVGTQLGAHHFIAGQHVDITAATKGKGFQGVMKKHGFSGQPRTHGVSLAHRSTGSIGQQGYARVLPGKKMPGRMGGVKVTHKNAFVYRCDPLPLCMYWACPVHVRASSHQHAKCQCCCTCSSSGSSRAWGRAV